jgi:hypothetical protein
MANDIPAHWQHVRPQREPYDCYPIKPDPDRKATYRCVTCGKRIHWVKANTGPESLAAFFKF